MRRYLNWFWEQKYYLFFFFFLFVLIWTQWFLPDQIIAGGDYFPPIEPWGIMRKVFYSWSPDYLGMGTFMEITKIFPFYFFYGVFDFLGFSPFVIERLWFIFMNLVGGLGLLFFVKEFFPSIKSVPAKLTALSFYLFNIVIVTEFNHDTGLFAYYFLPIFAASLLYATRLRNLKGAAVFVLASSLLLPVASNPGVLIVVLCAVFSIFLIHVFTSEKLLRWPMVKFAFWLILLFFLINSFWIADTLAVLFQEDFNSPFSRDELSWDWVIDKSKRSTLYNLFLLLAKFSWFSSFYSEPTFPYAPIYSKWFMVFSMIFVMLFAFSSLILSRFAALYKRVLAVAFLFLFSILLAKGAHEPFADIFHFLFNNIPGFEIFREPYTKFIAVLPFMVSLLILVAANFLLLMGVKVWKKILVVFILICVNFFILLNAWPLLFGEQTLKSRLRIADYVTVIPNYWLEASHHLNQDEEKLTNLYISPPGDYLYKWGYGGHAIDRKLIFAPRVQGQSIILDFAKDILINEFQRSLVRGDLKTFNYLSDLLRIDTILHRNDIDWFWNTKYLSRFQNEDVVKDPVVYENFLLSNENLVVDKRFGDLTLFKRKQGAYGFISIPKRSIYFTTNNVKSVLYFAIKNNFNSEDLILFDKDLYGLQQDTLNKIKSRIDFFVVSPKITNIQFEKRQFALLPGEPYILEIPIDADYQIILNPEGVFPNLSVDKLKFIFESVGGDRKELEVVFSAEEKSDLRISLKEGQYNMQIMGGDKFISPLSFDDIFLVYDVVKENGLNGTINVEKEAPTHFNAKFLDERVEPFFLVFHQTFTSAWQLHTKARNLPSHFQGNFYSNVWFVDEDVAKGESFSVTYIFQPYFLLFFVVSVFLIVGALIYLLISFLNAKKED